MNYTGDVKICRLTDPDNDGNYDIVWINGQPEMTDSFDTYILYAVYGDKNTWQNAIAEKEEEKYISDFPDVIENGTVSEKTKNDGIQALKKALESLKTIKAAQDIIVTGQIISVYAIGWAIKIVRKDGEKFKWSINWEGK